jgi:hypothetical protein
MTCSLSRCKVSTTQQEPSPILSELANFYLQKGKNHQNNVDFCKIIVYYSHVLVISIIRKLVFAGEKYVCIH